MNDMYIKIGDISKLKFGIATYVINLLSSYPYEVEFDVLYNLLRDKRLFNKFGSYNYYLVYVINKSTYGPIVMGVKSNISKIYKDNSKLQPYQGYLITLSELEYIFTIYDLIVFKSINNIRHEKPIYDFKIDLDIDRIISCYNGERNEEDSIDSFMKALECFTQYNNFLYMGYDADYYSNSKILTMNFFVDE